MLPDLLPPLAVVLLLLAFDLQNAFVPFSRVVLRPSGRSTRDYTIVIPLFGDPSYWRNRHHLEPYKDRVLLACNIDTVAMAEFADRVEAEGWRVFRSWDDHRISPVQTLAKALSVIDTTWMMRLDGDSYPEDDFGKAVAAAEDADADLCSVKVLPSRRHTVAEHLQGVEYDLAMRSRHLRPWATSGACMIARTEAMKAIMRRHSMWFFGEDIETGVIAEQLQMRVRHIDFVVYTEVPSTLRELFRQRKGWWAGHFQLAVLNIEQQLRFPALAVYNLCLIYILFEGKWHDIFVYTHVLPTLILVYTLMTTITNWPVRSRWLIAFPYYSLIQVLVMPPVGAYYYVRTRIRWKRPGRYRIEFFRTRPGAPRMVRPLDFKGRLVRYAWHAAFIAAILSPLAVLIAGIELL
ncbi:glycosyltransferase [Thermoleophilum album]|uniref:Glycosyltransferase, catalytic subunit of cellulose synthase and poly-beta-1,6-N-acetylglucosamine synthase n=1 Tax=Thermoleophilum album TaxID=29539 RepID=A0A1H6FQH7_THEAL|nr:glycosyltransferase family 2 protein [Thermoleophilum album]SEH12460.1 Glycosyltransferase, catalytic subunit of cellulose synthase and poly-beta-1,6-N-acetylglucosamine synthase [Thermoleophilum album]